MRYITCLMISYLLFFYSNSTNNDVKDQKPDITALINSKSLTVYSVSTPLYYYDIAATPPRWKVYIDAFDDYNYIKIMFDRFTADGLKILETTYNLNALNNPAFWAMATG